MWTSFLLTYVKLRGKEDNRGRFIFIQSYILFLSSKMEFQKVKKWRLRENVDDRDYLRVRMYVFKNNISFPYLCKLFVGLNGGQKKPNEVTWKKIKNSKDR